MKQVIPEIYVKSCRKALDFYQEVFGGTVKNLQMSDDLELFRDRPGLVVHAELHVNSRCVFYFVDVFEPSRSIVGNVTMVLHMDDQNELRRVYEQLQKNGTVIMELQQTFWGAWHAIVTDCFGAPWALTAG